MSKGIDQQVVQEVRSEAGDVLEKAQIRRQNEPPKQAALDGKFKIEKNVTAKVVSAEELADTSFSASLSNKRKQSTACNQDFSSIRSTPSLETFTENLQDTSKKQNQAQDYQRLDMHDKTFSNSRTILDRLVDWIATQIKRLEQKLLALLEPPQALTKEIPIQLSEEQKEEYECGNETLLHRKKRKQSKKKWFRTR